MNSFFEFLNYAKISSEILVSIGIVSSIIAFSKRNFFIKETTVPYAICLAVLLIYRIGFQPIGFGLHGDREIYAYSFIVNSSEVDFSSHDWLLSAINYVLHPICDVETYFVIIASLYVGLYLFAIYRLSRHNSYWLFVAVAVSFGYTSYGYNTLRAGLAIAFILVGISYYFNIKKMALFLFLGVSTHFSMIIPVSALLVSRYWPKTELYYKLWLLSIPVSFVAGGFFNTFFSSWSGDVRTNYLTTANDAYKIGFRIEFILYSLLPMAIGAYYIFKKGYTDKLYVSLYNTYLLANIFWILVIRANYSDRFAYLSWFLLPVILVYPILDGIGIKQPGKWLGFILLGESLFKLMI